MEQITSELTYHKNVVDKVNPKPCINAISNTPLNTTVVYEISPRIAKRIKYAHTATNKYGIYKRFILSQK